MYNNTNIYSQLDILSCTVSTRMSTGGQDDWLLNEVLQSQKQLILPGIHIKLIVLHFEATIYRS